MIEDVIYGHKEAEFILMPIDLNGHYHLLVLDIPKSKVYAVFVPYVRRI